MALEQRRLIQAVEPAGEPFHPVRVRRKGVHRHETRDRVHVSRRGRVPPCGVESAVRLGPHRGPAVHRGYELGLAALELGAERFAEEVVIPVPAPAAVERHDEQRRLLQRLEPGCRLARAAHDDVAQRAAHRLEDRRPGEKGDIGGVELREVLQAEVVHDKPVLTGELRDRATMTSPVAQNEARKVQAGSPALRSLPELVGNGLELRLDAAEEQLRVAPAERQVLDADLEHLAIGAQSRDRQLGELAAREHERRSRRHVQDERGEHGGRRARANRLDVVDDQHDRLGEAVEEGREPSGTGRPGAPRGPTVASSASIEPLRLRAAVTHSNNVDASSPPSRATHANRRASRSAHCDRRVVFPYPAGATSVTSRWPFAARRRLTSPGRGTVPGRTGGIAVFARRSNRSGAPAPAPDRRALVAADGRRALERSRRRSGCDKLPTSPSVDSVSVATPTARFCHQSIERAAPGQ